MRHTAFWSWSPVLLAGLLSLPACGQQDSPEAVAAECSGPIPREKVDDCLERARVIDETNPSAPLQSLEAQLELRARHHEMAQGGPPPGYGPPPQQAYGPPRGLGPQQGDESNQPPPGYEDQMPHDQGGPLPDEPPPDMHMGDQAPPPEGPSGDMAPPSDETGPGEVMPPEDNAQGPPPDNTPPPDDSETQGPGQ